MRDSDWFRLIGCPRGQQVEFPAILRAGRFQLQQLVGKMEASEAKQETSGFQTSNKVIKAFICACQLGYAVARIKNIVDNKETSIWY